MAGILRKSLVVAASSALIVPLAAGTAQATPSHKSGSSAPVVVVSGLNNPRQLSLVDDAVLLIAEAGKGGTLAVIDDPEGGKQGLGFSGSVSAVLAPAWVHNQHPFRIVKGLLSAAAAEDTPDGPKGGGATGPDGVSATSLQRIGVIETNFGPDAPAQNRNGHLLLTRPFGLIHPFADITGFENDHDPDGMGIDSNPYAVLAYRNGWLVADAAGNDVLRVDRFGHRSVFHKFRNVTTGPCAGQFDPGPPFAGCNFVPTSLASDRWGNVYVGGLSGLTPGQARVVKLDKHGHTLKVWNGFTSVTGVAVGHDGALYVSQLFADPSAPGLPGVLTRIKGNNRTNVDVPFPAGVAVDSRNNVFVSAFSIAPGTGAGIPGIDSSGQVWRLRF
jgi:hypothetical protein